jgi:hypothetical protein
VTGRTDITHAALLAVVTANAAALCELRVAATTPQCEALLRAAPQLRVFGSAYCVSAEHVKALLRSAPQLHCLDAKICFPSREDARRMLRNEPPFGPLHVRELVVRPEGGEAGVLPGGTHGWPCVAQRLQHKRRTAKHACGCGRAGGRSLDTPHEPGSVQLRALACSCSGLGACAGRRVANRAGCDKR